MPQENGKNIYNKLTKYITYAKEYEHKHNYDKCSEYIGKIINLVVKTTSIEEVLNVEMICIDLFDTNVVRNNLSKVANKLLACETALNENDFFTNNKQGYLNNFQNSRIKDITKDSAFEKAAKEIINYLGAEKRQSLISDEACEFFEARQNNIRRITQEFKKERISFLEKHIPREQNQSVTKSKNKQFER